MGFDWIIDGDYIYGSAIEETGYIMSLGGHDIRNFQSLDELDNYLYEFRVPIYDLNKTENISYLKYDNGRNRVYK